jgi:hypothetical protein
MLSVFVITGFVLCGVVEQSASVALRANSTSSYSAAEFAEYVENTSYITRYCQPPSNKTVIHVVRSIPHIEVRRVSTHFLNIVMIRLTDSDDSHRRNRSSSSPSVHVG